MRLAIHTILYPSLSGGGECNYPGFYVGGLATAGVVRVAERDFDLLELHLSRADGGNFGLPITDEVRLITNRAEILAYDDGASFYQPPGEFDLQVLLSDHTDRFLNRVLHIAKPPETGYLGDTFVEAPLWFVDGSDDLRF